MKKFAMSLALLGGIVCTAGGSVSAADWRGGGYRGEPVRHIEPVRRDFHPSVNRYNDGCFPTTIQRYEPIRDYRRFDDRYDWNRHDDYRYFAPKTSNKGFGFMSPDLSFWFGR